MPIVLFLTTSDLIRPDQNSYFSWTRCRAAYHGFNYPVPHASTLLPSSLQEPPRWSAGQQTEDKYMNTLAQAEVRRNRLNNNTTHLSPAPDQAICNCWHKRKVAGYSLLPSIQNHAEFDWRTLTDFLITDPQVQSFGGR